MAMIQEEDLRLIEGFADALWLERGLSRNTLAAYQSDLRKLNAWLRDERDYGLLQANRGDLLGYLASLSQRGGKPRSSARSLSCIRQFYQHALREGWIQGDPSVRIDAPRLGRPLPKSLSEAEVEALLAAPDLADAEGLRDRSMLELLYATGLRLQLPVVAVQTAAFARIVTQTMRCGKVRPDLEEITRCHRENVQYLSISVGI